MFSVLVTLRDATEKEQALVPHMFNFDDELQAEEVARFYACAKEWIDVECSSELPRQNARAYLQSQIDNNRCADTLKTLIPPKLGPGSETSGVTALHYLGKIAGVGICVDTISGFSMFSSWLSNSS